MKNIIFLIIAVNSYIVNAQCQIKEVDLDNDRKLITMSEKYYENEDLENGVMSFYLTTNNYVLSENKSLVEIVVSYFSIGHRYWIVPNTLIIELATGKNIISKSTEKSNNTFNRRSINLKNTQSIECYFNFTHEELLEMGTEDLISIKVMDYKTEQIINITPRYKGQLSEMLKCVLKL